jgi:hypothetical protein
VYLGAAVVTNKQPLEVVQPGEGALDDPASAPEAGAVLGLAAGAANAAAHRRDPLKKRDQLGDVVAITARECPSERDPGRVD